MRRFAITVGLSLTFGTGLVATTIRPAAAGYNVGVKYVHLDSTRRRTARRKAVLCRPGSEAPPWLPGLPTNTIYIRPDRDRRRLPLHGLRRGRCLVDEGPDRAGARGRLSLRLPHPRSPPLRGRELGRGHGHCSRGGLQLVALDRRRRDEVVLDAHRSRRRHRLRRAKPPPSHATTGSCSAQHPTSTRAASASSSGPWRTRGSTRRQHGSRPGATWCSSSTTRRSPAAGPGCSIGSGT